MLKNLTSSSKIAKIDILATILKFLGLVTHKRAKETFIQLTAIREKALMQDVQKDFGIPPKANYEQSIKEWAAQAWEDATKESRKEIWLMLEDEAIEKGYISGAHS